MSSLQGAQPTAPDDSKYAAAFARLDQYVRQRMDSGEERGPGLAIAITNRDRLLHLAIYGFADLAARQPVTPATLFEVGSVGKSFVALALLQQHEAGRLDLSAPITQYLPWFSINSDYPPITVHHVLSHSAGLPTGMNFTASSPRYEVAALRDQHTGAAPGDQFWYSNVGYMLLGLLLEQVSGLPYAAALQHGILDRLDMRDSVPIITHTARPRLAVPYLPLYDDRPWHRGQPLLPTHWLEYTAGDGSVACTIADFVAYLRMMLNRGQGVVSAGSFARFITPAIATDWDDASYGYGIAVRTDPANGHTIISHGGEMVGYHAHLRGDLDDGLGVVAFTNGPGESYDEADYAFKLALAAMCGEPLPDIPPIADPLQISNAAEYAGTYHLGDHPLTVVAEGERLFITHHDAPIPLERRAGDAFYTPHPNFEMYNLVFARDEGSKVVEAFHGPDWYVNESYSGPHQFDYPPHWSAYLGHYRSHNPWMQDFRVFVRKGQLQSISFGTWRRPLTPLPDGSFRLDEEAHSPERMRFDTIVDGQAMRAIVSGADYYRVDTA